MSSTEEDGTPTEVQQKFNSREEWEANRTAANEQPLIVEEQGPDYNVYSSHFSDRHYSLTRLPNASAWLVMATVHLEETVDISRPKDGYVAVNHDEWEEVRAFTVGNPSQGREALLKLEGLLEGTVGPTLEEVVGYGRDNWPAPSDPLGWKARWALERLIEAGSVTGELDVETQSEPYFYEAMSQEEYEEYLRYLAYMEEEEARGELAFAPKTLPCYQCRPGIGEERAVVKLGRTVNNNIDPTTTYIVECGHTVLAG